MFGLVTFSKVKLHSPSSIMKSVHPLNYDMLDFCVQGGQLGDGNLGKSKGGMWS
jgi:hypothetical protein